jgi:hypothetical protein
MVTDLDRTQSLFYGAAKENWFSPPTSGLTVPTWTTDAGKMEAPA